MERGWEVRARMLEIFDVIVAEFESDPASVQCFDLRIVEEAKRLNREFKQIQRRVPYL